MARFCSIGFRLGEKLTRTLEISVYNWGVRIVCEDFSDGAINKSFDARNFRKTTKKYPSIEDNIKRGLRYFNAPSEEVERILAVYRSSLGGVYEA